MRPLVLALAVAALAACDSTPLDPAMEEGGYRALSAGSEHTCAITQEGSLYCWGSNRSGQLGTAYDPAFSLVPVRTGTTERFRSLSAGAQHACAIDEQDRLFCWGGNHRGQLGNASRINQGLPVQVAPGMRFARVSAGWFHTCAVTVDGVALCWGAAAQAQAGGAPGDDVLVPRLVSSMRFSDVSAGGFHSCGLDTSGRAWCWGANTYGQLGDGGLTNSGEPRAVVGGASYRVISAGYTHTCGVLQDYTPLCWGSSDFGELGHGGQAVPGLSGAEAPHPLHGGHHAVHIDAGHYATCMTADTAWGWCWGRGDSGQLGTGTTWDAWTPQYVTAGIVHGERSTVNVNFVSMSVGLQHACGLTREHVVFCWGRGTDGQLGAGPIRYSPLPVRVAAGR